MIERKHHIRKSYWISSLSSNDIWMTRKNIEVWQMTFDVDLLCPVFAFCKVHAMDSRYASKTSQSLTVPAVSRKHKGSSIPGLGGFLKLPTFGWSILDVVNFCSPCKFHEWILKIHYPLPTIPEYLFVLPFHTFPYHPDIHIWIDMYIYVPWKWCFGKVIFF